MINGYAHNDIYAWMGPASARSFMPPKSTVAAGPSCRKFGDNFFNMTDYLKFYARYYGITWDHQKFEVHHIDGNRKNNDIWNLLLLPKELHKRLHHSGWFDLERYEEQLLKFGQSNENLEELQSRIDTLDECRKWAVMRTIEYRKLNGQPIYEITEETEL